MVDERMVPLTVAITRPLRCSIRLGFHWISTAKSADGNGVAGQSPPEAESGRLQNAHRAFLGMGPKGPASISVPPPPTPIPP